jgi:hypothetical protein
MLHNLRVIKNRPLRLQFPAASWRCLLALLLLVLLCGGCASIRVTDPARTATEQFLISQAASTAVKQLSAANLRDRKVYIDTTYLTGSGGAASAADANYLIADVRAKFLLEGVRLMDSRKDADIIVEVRSGALGIDRSNLLVGLPAIMVPNAVTGGSDTPVVATPELAIIKNVKQRGYASIAFVAYWRDTGEAIASSGPFVAHTSRNDWWFFGVGPQTSGDIPPARQGQP